MAGSILSNPALTPCVCQCVWNSFGSAEAANAPGRTAGSAAATTAATAGSAASAASAAAASATPSHLHGAARGSRVFLVEQVERGETDVGDFFFAKRERLSRRIVRGLLHVRGRHSRCGCAAYQRESQSGGTQCGHGGFGYTLRLRSLLHPWHRHILHYLVIFVSSPALQLYARRKRAARLVGALRDLSTVQLFGSS